MDAPVLGALESTYSGPNRWRVSTSWRYQKSDRHFRGAHEEPNRQAEGSEVINHLNLAEIGIGYTPNPLWSFSVNIPYMIAERSSPIRDSNRVVVDRSISHASGLSDITLSGRRWVKSPTAGQRGNVAIGLGVKLPTGRSSVQDTRERMVNGQIVTTIESVDQSIQPGDGGFGAILDVQAYQRVLAHGALYGSAAYLFNPRGTNGTLTFRGSAGEEVMSVADQYVARLGGSYASPSWKGLELSLGGRLEGVPVEDVFGHSRGFRRPGYAVSAEPGLSYSTGPHTLSLSVPYALYRNRTRSVPDREVPGRHGDAAFADYVITAGYWRRF